MEKCQKHPNSLFRFAHNGVRVLPLRVTLDNRKISPELSNSLFNRPLWVNNPVTLAPRVDFELFYFLTNTLLSKLISGEFRIMEKLVGRLA